MKSYLKINWNGLHKIAKEKSLGDACSQFYTDMRDAKKKFEEFEKKYRDLSWKKKMASFKALPADTLIYYTGTDKRIAGRFGKKVSDGTKKMKIHFVGLDNERWNGVWSIPYRSIQLEPLTQQQLTLLKISQRINAVQ